MIVKTKYDAGHRPGKLCKDPKVTVANKSMSIRDVVNRFASGQPLDIPAAQHGEQQVPMGEYDLADRYRLKMALLADLAQVQKDKQERLSQEAEQKRKDDIDAAVAARLKEKESEGYLPPKPSDA